MGGLAPGGLGPVVITGSMGISALIVGSLVDPVAGLVPLFGICCIMISIFFANFAKGTSTIDVTICAKKKDTKQTPANDIYSSTCVKDIFCPFE